MQPANAQDAFRRLADSLSLASDQDFFAQVVESLARILVVDHVLVARIEPDGEHATTLALWSNGRLAENFRYPLAGTPCAEVTGHRPCHFSKVCHHYPEDRILADLKVDAYLGVPMHAPDGTPLGLVAVMHGQPIDPARSAEEILRITAARAGAELARQESERRSRERLLSTNRALKLLSRGNEALIHADDEQQLLAAICRLAVDIGGYRMAWVGYVQHDEAKRLIPQASAGVEDGYLQQLDLSWSERMPNGHGPAGLATRSGEPVLVDDLARDERLSPWRDAALARGYRSLISLPLKSGEQVIGVLTMYQADPSPISGEELQLLSELADNLAFGIDTLRARIAQQRIQRAVMRIATAVSARSGEEFLDQLTHHMAQALDAELGFIASLDANDPRQAHVLVIVIDGQRQDNFSYYLEGSPCENVLIEAECIVHDNAARRLPVEARESLGWVRAYAGRRLDNAAGEPVGLLGVMFRQPLDDTELATSVLQIFAAGASAELERQQDEARIRRLAYHDQATDLPNRIAFMQRLQHALSQPDKPRLALLFLDLDRFKDINDTQGHDIGDKVLIEVTQRFKQAHDHDAYLARLGGDEFVVMLDPADLERARHTAERLHDSLDAPLLIDQQAFDLDVSIGIAFYPDDAGSARELLKHTDIAMYRAKQQGGGYRFYETWMGAALASRLQMAKRLAGAISNQTLDLHFQPQVELSNGRMVGAEVLCRWHDEELGHVSPGEFIPLAEERGLISALGNWVIDATCRQLAIWQTAGLTMPGQMAINVASQQFDDDTLLATLVSASQRHGIAPHRLGLELTESGFMSDPDQAIAMTEALKSAGFGLSIDDFGTGYSSLAYLKRFAADKIKIDMSFVRDMLDNDNDHAIVTTIIAMARSLSLDTVAEGVETREQADALLALGCRQAQGFYFGKPLDAERFAATWLIT